MFVVCVDIQVKPEHRDAFVQATLANARGTRQEPGNLRFDVLVSQDDPNHFVLYEVYRDPSGLAAHQQNQHYLQWRETCEPFMAAPRQRQRLSSVFPEADSEW